MRHNAVQSVTVLCFEHSYGLGVIRQNDLRWASRAGASQSRMANATVQCFQAVCYLQLAMRPTPIITGLMFVGAGAYLLGLPALLLWLSGDWRWIEGWIFGVWFPVLFAASL